MTSVKYFGFWTPPRKLPCFWSDFGSPPYLLSADVTQPRKRKVCQIGQLFNPQCRRHLWTDPQKPAVAATKTPPTNRPGEIDLGMRAKDEKQFVRWRDFQAAFDADRIVVYAHHRNGRYVESVTNTHSMVYKVNCKILISSYFEL